MWLPIIHNMREGDPAYAMAQKYNALVAAKPKVRGTLEEKLKVISAWQIECSKALDDVKQIMGVTDNA